jgi:hypothetical protein
VPPTLHPLPLDLGPQLQFMAWLLPNDGNDGMVARAATGHFVRPGGDNAHPLEVGQQRCHGGFDLCLPTDWKLCDLNYSAFLCLFTFQPNFIFDYLVVIGPQNWPILQNFYLFVSFLSFALLLFYLY